MKPLFIPLMKKYFEQFERGEKHFEFRPFGPRWNYVTCEIGREVTHIQVSKAISYHDSGI